MNLSRTLVGIGVALLSVFSNAQQMQKDLPLELLSMLGKGNMGPSSLDENLLLPEESSSNAEESPGFPNYIIYNRGLLGSQLLRGQESEYDTGPFFQKYEYLGMDGTEKRGIKSFHGMRGKKQFEFPVYSYPDKRKLLGFQGMRGKKSNLEESLRLYQALKNRENELNDLPYSLGMNQNIYADDYLGADFPEKRGLRGFQGMRGKRDYDDSNSLESKRAPSGFLGMRGKKDNDEQHNEESDNGESKSKAQGMKEEVGSTILPTANIKDQLAILDNFGNGDAANTNMLGSIREGRSPGYYGKGHKMPYMSYFGTRGKKGPYDYPFRGSFVGVRGKKSDRMHQLAERLSWAGEYEKRRGPSGFVGMRGKKSITPDDEFDAVNMGEE